MMHRFRPSSKVYALVTLLSHAFVVCSLLCPASWGGGFGYYFSALFIPVYNITSFYQHCAHFHVRLTSLNVAAGVPIPSSSASQGGKVQAAISAALAEAVKKRIRGAATTPFLLERVQQLTGGLSLALNIKLVKNNAKVGAAIAVALVS